MTYTHVQTATSVLIIIDNYNDSEMDWHNEQEVTSVSPIEN